MNLNRKDISKEYYGKHNNIDTNSKESVISYLNELDKYLNNYEYESDSDFIFCGRKKFIYDEIMEIVNGTKSVDNPIYFILGSLEEFMSNNNDIHISDSDSLGMSWNELRDANDRYISTGVICLEEKNYIDKIIDKIKCILAVKDRITNYEGEFKVLKSICEVCVNYNDGKRNNECPLNLIDKIEKNEITCPNFKKEDLFEKRMNQLGDLNNDREIIKSGTLTNEQSINKGINTSQEEPWVNYLIIDDITLERKISDEAPEEIKLKYQEYLNKKEELALNIISKELEKLSNDSEITILELLSTQPERYDDTSLVRIATKFFEKYKDSIEFTNKSTEKVGLIYNLPFKKRIIF